MVAEKGRHAVAGVLRRCGVADSLNGAHGAPHSLASRFRETVHWTGLPLHPASRQSRYFQLRGLGLLRHEFPPCGYLAFTGALVSVNAVTSALKDWPSAANALAAGLPPIDPAR